MNITKNLNIQYLLILFLFISSYFGVALINLTIFSILIYFFFKIKKFQFDIADKLSVDPKTLAIALIFAVNTSFLTPLAYQTNLLVMGPGHYKFIDYVKFGLPLTVLCWFVFFITFPIFYKV